MASSLIPLSEIYLFSELPPIEYWENPSPTNLIETQRLVDLLLRNLIPLKSIKGFPQMGSFSSVSQKVTDQILNDRRPLYTYKSEITDNILTSKPTKLEPVTNAAEALRYAGTLRVFDKINTRIVKRATGQYTRDDQLLARAEISHSTILQSLINIFREKGYETRSNKFVDLFAHNERRSFLFEIKSTENKNFRTQARKGLVQLFEYDYFEIKKFIVDNKFNFQDRYKILVPSKVPEDNRYVEFINDLKTGVAVIENRSLKAVGSDFGFTKI